MTSPMILLGDPGQGVYWRCDHCDLVFATKQEANKHEIRHRFSQSQLEWIDK